MEYQKQSVIEDIKGKKGLISEKYQDKLPIARIDFLSFSGKVCSCEEYATEQAFLETLNEELHYGVPLNVILYRDQNGKTISRKFLEELDTLPTHIEEHSKKPQEARERIVQLMGDVPRLELFARQKSEGWDVWGNEVECDIVMAQNCTDVTQQG